jgi:hypothetical protein
LTIAELAQTPTTLKGTDEWVFNQGRIAADQARNAVEDLRELYRDIERWTGMKIPHEQRAIEFIDAYQRLVTGVSVLRMSTEFFESRRSLSVGWRSAQEIMVNMQRDFSKSFLERIALLLGVNETVAMAASLINPLALSRIAAEAQYAAFSSMIATEVDGRLQTAFNRFRHDMNMMHMQTDAWLGGAHINPGWYDNLFITLRFYIR